MKASYGFFPGCSYETAAGYAESVQAVCRTLDLTLVEIADWNCCGATSLFSLHETDALLVNARLLALANRQGFDQVVTVCNACYTTLRKAIRVFETHPDLLATANAHLAGESLQVERLLPVRHLLEILYHDVDEDIWQQCRPRNWAPVPVAAYYGCQLTRPWSDVDHPEHPTLMDRFIERLGFVVVEHSAKTLCCGASHVLPHEKACRKLIERILTEIQGKGARLISTVCPLCQFNLDAKQHQLPGPNIAVPYFTQLAGLALGISPSQLGLKKLLVAADLRL